MDELSEQRNRYAVVHFKDGRRLLGWVGRYSDDAADRALFLEQASWLTDEGAFVNDPLINVLVDHETGISFIEFVEPRAEPANGVETTAPRAAAARPFTETPEHSQPQPAPSARTPPWVWLFTVAVVGYLFLERRIRHFDQD